MTPRRALRRALLATFAMALPVAACGGSSDSSEPADAGAADPAVTETAPDGEDAGTNGTTGGGGEDDPGAVGGAGSVADDAGEPAAAAPEALRFTAPLVGGGELDAATLADKPTVFWFWAPT